MAGTLSTFCDIAGMIETLLARRGTAGPARTQPGLRHRVWDTIAVGKPSHSQDAVVLVEMPTGQPGRRPAGRVAVGITGSPSGKPGRRRENRVAVGITGSPSGQQGRRDADGSAGSPSGWPGRRRDNRVAVGKTGSPSG